VLGAGIRLEIVEFHGVFMGIRYWEIRY
jgi:hypothetical protein